VTGRRPTSNYARALLQVAVEEGDPEAIERELGAFQAFMEGQPVLTKALLSPAIPVARKRALLADVLARGSGITTVTSRLLLLLAERDRLALLPDLIAAYRERLLDYRQVVRAEVTTAAPLGDDRVRALEAGLTRATGKRVSVTTRLDPAIIGGVVARVGSLVYDGSVMGHLARLRERLTETA
jgi:F-type H+-transporting ATPase subunit delta